MDSTTTDSGLRREIRKERSENLGVSTTYILDVLIDDAKSAATEAAKTQAANAEYPIDLDAPTFIGIAKVMCKSDKSKGYGILCPRDRKPNCSLVDALDLGSEPASDKQVNDLKQLELKIEEQKTTAAEGNKGGEADRQREIKDLKQACKTASMARKGAKGSEAGEATHFVSWVSLAYSSARSLRLDPLWCVAGLVLQNTHVRWRSSHMARPTR